MASVAASSSPSRVREKRRPEASGVEGALGVSRTGSPVSGSRGIETLLTISAFEIMLLL
jgi:hypothetical protein